MEAKQINVVYANANSLFDYTNGASKSIKLILEELASNGCGVFAITGCSSNAKGGYDFTLKKWESVANSEGSERSILQRFIVNGVNYSLIRTGHWSRNFLAALEQEYIYREASSILEKVSQASSSNLFLGWGSLLLEEAMFLKAKSPNISTCFYLVNPSYKGGECLFLERSDFVITDSISTKQLYMNERSEGVYVLPKCVEKPGIVVDPFDRYEFQRLTLVNPSLKKGLAPFIEIARHFEKVKPSLEFHLVDARNGLSKHLKRLGEDIDSLPKNILVDDGDPSVDAMLSKTSILLLLSLWHESGSRLIHESHLRGIPVLGFRVGGNAQLLREFGDQDLFDLPSIDDTYCCNGGWKAWAKESMCIRIESLISNKSFYADYSEKVSEKASRLLASNNAYAAKEITSLVEKYSMIK
tara:strand:- start:1851 stop:3089 length:1239 start_codon:yes stop_codon:yes gene_type:complete